MKSLYLPWLEALIFARLPTSPLAILLVGGVVATALCYLFFDSLVWQPLRRHVRATVGEFPHLDVLGKKRTGPKIRGTCVVAGQSIAGLLAARVALDHFERVVVVEPDSELQEKRSRVAQWPHAHYFGNGFYRGVKSLFPSVFDEEAEKQGIFLHDPGLGHYIFGDRSLPSTETGCVVFGAQRMAMERLLRRALVRWCTEGQDPIASIKGSVMALVPTQDGKRIAKVQIREGDGKEYAVQTSLVIDCTGSAASGVKWLAAKTADLSKVESGVEHHAPWQEPPSWSYRPSLTYYTALVRVKAEDMASLPKPPSFEGKSWKEVGVITAQIPSLLVSDHTQLALLLHGEMGTFTFLAAGRPKAGACVKTIADFRRTLKDLESEVVGSDVSEWQKRLINAFEKLERDGKVEVDFRQYRNGMCTYHRYHEAKKLPADFVAVGDAVSFTNPRFAMGTRKIITELGALNAMLHGINAIALAPKPLMPSSLLSRGAGGVSAELELPMDFGKRYFADVHKRDVKVWEFCLAEDYALQTTKLVDEGDVLKRGWFERWYRLALGRVAAKDKDVAGLIFRLFASDVKMSPIDPLHPVLFARTLMQLPAVMWQYKLGGSGVKGGSCGKMQL